MVRQASSTGSDALNQFANMLRTNQNQQSGRSPFAGGSAGGNVRTGATASSNPAQSRLVQQQNDQAKKSTNLGDVVNGVGYPKYLAELGNMQQGLPKDDGWVNPPTTGGAGGGGISDLLHNVTDFTKNVANSAFAGQGAQATEPVVADDGSVGGFSFSQPQSFGKSLSDYTNAAGDGSNLIAGLLAQYQNERDLGNAKSDQNSANLSSIYDQMRTETKGDQSDSAARYQQANTDIADSGAVLQAALAAMDKGQAKDAQAGSAERGTADAAQKSAQGIKDSGGLDQVLAAAGTDTNTGLNTAQGNSAGDVFDARLGAIAPQEADSQAGLADSLQNYLSQINSNEAQSRYQASQDAYNQAVQQYGADSDAFYNDQNLNSNWEQNVWGQQQDIAAQEADAYAQQQQAAADAAGTAVGRDKAAQLLGQYGANGETTQNILNLIAGSIGNTGYTGGGANDSFTPDALMEAAQNNNGGTGSISNWADVGDESARAMQYAQYALNNGIIDDATYQQMVNVIPTYFAK